MENNLNILQYQIALTLIPGIGSVLAKNLISYCGSAEAVFKEKEKSLLKIPEIGTVLASQIINKRDDALHLAEDECRFVLKNNIRHLFYTEKDYPQRLKNCNDAPVLIFYSGNINFNAGKVIGIVGTRNATDYGKNFCDKLIEDLKIHTNMVIVSGLAYGIDIGAHKAALKNNISTVAVLAHGLDRIYPPAHSNIAGKMLENGGLATEFLSGTNPDKENFPKRNRIVAGMCDAIIVVEAAQKGGALITASIANSYNRDVFALPGRINDTYSEGCNYLIKSNQADLITGATDLEYKMGWEKIEGKQKPKNLQRQLMLELLPEEQMLVGFLNEKGKQDIDTISINAGVQVSKIASTLLSLEFKGIVKALPGKVYELV